MEVEHNALIEQRVNEVAHKFRIAIFKGGIPLDNIREDASISCARLHVAAMIEKEREEQRLNDGWKRDVGILKTLERKRATLQECYDAQCAKSEARRRAHNMVLTVNEKITEELASARACHQETLMQNKAAIATLEAENKRLVEEVEFYKQSMVKIAATVGITDSIQLIAKSENNQETYVDILCKVITEKQTTIRQHLRAVCEAAERGILQQPKTFSDSAERMWVNDLQKALTEAKPFLTAGGEK